MPTPDKVDFTFSWRALNLLGQGLYSNPWSALSELVANGFDARATDVHVYLDMRNGKEANIEIFDNGTGMDRTQLSTYARVGFNKREDTSSTQPTSAKPMGRKGIGKLAALYLTNTFYIRTRVAGAPESAWLLDASQSNVDLDDTPALQEVADTPDMVNQDIWDTYASGTFLSLRNVDLTGHGSQALASLGTRLANQFSLQGSGPPRQILLFVHTEENGDRPPNFKPAAKKIAFKNFIFMGYRDATGRSLASPPDQLAQSVTIPAPGLAGGACVKSPEATFLALRPDATIDGWSSIADRVDLSTKKFDGLSFNLTGWVGLHATINKQRALLNDDKFEKNRFYNPAQLRLYVRGKLASDRLLDQLGLTSTYLNYIEGELAFDLLDEDTLDDIATSNRQDFDETDDRVILLRALVRPIIRELIAKRNKLAAEIGELVEKEKRDLASASKVVFSQQLERDLESIDIADGVRATIQNLTVNKLVGDVTPKDKFRVFISHASKDSSIGNFIYHLLLNRGVRETELFYTSRPNSSSQFDDKRPLPVVIKENITDYNTQIFYLTSRNFTASEFCLFEGGAGWATRAVNTLLKLNVEYDAVPKFLTEGNLEMQMLDADGKIELRGDLHNYLVTSLLNPMIAHINQGRTVASEPLVPPFVAAVFPEPMVMASDEKDPSDYFDTSLKEHWEFYVGSSSADYLSTYPFPKGSRFYKESEAVTT